MRFKFNSFGILLVLLLLLAFVLLSVLIKICPSSELFFSSYGLVYLFFIGVAVAVCIYPDGSKIYGKKSSKVLITWEEYRASFLFNNGNVAAHIANANPIIDVDV